MREASRTLRRTSLPLAALSLALFSPPCSAQGRVLAKVGDPVPAHEFRPLIGHDGRTRIEELYGHPVIVAGFKQHLDDGLHAAWVAKDLLGKYAKDGLIVILEDQIAWTRPNLPAKIQAFWMKFFAARVWISSNLDRAGDLPIKRSRSKRDTTSLVLIGVDGRLILEGSAENPADAEKKSDYRVAFKRAVASEMRRRKGGWGKEPVQRKVRSAAFGKENLAAAWRLVESASQGAKGAVTDALRVELDRAFGARKKVVEFLLEQGRMRAADRALTRLAKSVRGVARYEKQLDALLAALKSKQGRADLKLDRDLSRILKLVADRKFAKFGLEGILAVREFAAKHGSSRVAARATRLDPLLKHLVAFTKPIPIKKMEARLAEVHGKRRKK